MGSSADIASRLGLRTRLPAHGRLHIPAYLRDDLSIPQRPSPWHESRMRSLHSPLCRCRWQSRSHLRYTQTGFLTPRLRVALRVEEVTKREGTPASSKRRHLRERCATLHAAPSPIQRSLRLDTHINRQRHDPRTSLVLQERMCLRVLTLR